MNNDVKEIDDNIVAIYSIIKNYDDIFFLYNSFSENDILKSKSQILINANNLINDTLKDILIIKKLISINSPQLIILIDIIYKRVFDAIYLSHNTELKILNSNPNFKSILNLNFATYTNFLNQILKNISQFNSENIDNVNHALEIIDFNYIHINLQKKQIESRTLLKKGMDFIFNRKSKISLKLIVNNFVTQNAKNESKNSLEKNNQFQSNNNDKCNAESRYSNL